MSSKKSRIQSRIDKLKALPLEVLDEVSGGFRMNFRELFQQFNQGNVANLGGFDRSDFGSRFDLSDFGSSFGHSHGHSDFGSSFGHSHGHSDFGSSNNGVTHYDGEQFAQFGNLGRQSFRF